MDKTTQTPRFRKIVTHFRPHFDELLAIRLLKRHGGKLYPGIQDADVVYNRNGEAPEGKTWEEHQNEGTILVGVGGGPFDEHPTSQGEERKKRESACSLVAKKLAVDKNPVYKRLVQLVTECDQEGVHELHVANRMKTIYRLNPNNPQKAIDFALDILDDWEAEQRKFLQAQQELQDLRGTEQHLTVSRPGNELDIVVAISDNYKLGAAARSLKIAVLIQKQSTGHVQIFTNAGMYGFDMKYVAAALRKEEMKLNGRSKTEIEMIPDLECEGKIPEVLNWFYQVPGHNILNGSETTPDTAPTKIDLRKIAKFVRDFMFAESVVD